MRFALTAYPAAVTLNSADTWQKAGDIACAWIKFNDFPGNFVIAEDTEAQERGMVHPFVRYSRAEEGAPVGYVGTPYKTRAHAMADDDGRGYHVETPGGGVWTSTAWFATRAEADAEKARLSLRGIRSNVTR